MILYETRASTLLYNFFRSLDINGLTLLSSNICPIVPITLLKEQKPFDFIDIDQNDLCMNESIAIDRIRKDSRVKMVLLK